MNKPLLRVIGDVHGRHKEYLEACKNSQRSVQIGDLAGSDYSYSFYNNSNLSPNDHTFFGGNHDNYDVIDKSPYNMGDFGSFEIEGLGSVFFLRGAFSIDWKRRRHNSIQFDDQGELFFSPKDFWEEEQLTIPQLNEAFDLYSEVKPDIVLSHECPFFFLPQVTNPKVAKHFGYNNSLIETNTNLFLDSIYEVHRPKYHIFGHYHHWEAKKVDGTTLVCVPIMGAFDFYEDKVEPVNIGEDKYSNEIKNIVIR